MSEDSFRFENSHRHGRCNRLRPWIRGGILACLLLASAANANEIDLVKPAAPSAPVGRSAADSLAGNSNAAQQVAALLATADTQRSRQRYRVALGGYRRAVEIAEKAHLENAAILALHHISDLDLEQGNGNAARHAMEERRQRAQAAHDRRAEATACEDLAALLENQKDYASAESYEHRALTLWQKIGDRAAVDRNLQLLGALHKERGNLYQALVYQLRSATLKRQSGDRRGLIQTYDTLGTLYEKLGDDEEALAHHQKAHALAHELGDRQGMARSLANIGTIHLQRGELDDASRYLEQALTSSSELEDQPGIAHDLLELGILARRRGQPSNANDLLQRARSLFTALGDRRNGIATDIELAAVLLDRGQLEKAADQAERAADDANADNQTDLASRAYQTLADIAARRKDYASAYRFLSRYETLQTSQRQASQERRVADLRAARELDAQRAKISILERDNRIEELHLSQQRTVRDLLAVAGLAVLSLLLVLYRRYRREADLNGLLRDRNLRIEEQRREVARINEALAAKSTELESANQQLYRSSITDPLTGLANRNYLLSALSRELARESRHGQPLTCMMLDLDHFKSINDRFGHLAGDRALREVAHLLHGVLRQEDVVARYGGEELVVVLPDTDLQQAARVAEKVRRAIAELEIPSPQGSFTLTASIGIAELAQLTVVATADHLIQAADEALYRAKASGRDCIILAEAAPP